MKERLSEWMARFELPPLQSELRGQEEAAYEMLQNFFLLLLAASEEPWPPSPWQVLKRLAPDLSSPLPEPQGSPLELVMELGIGMPDSEFFALQERLIDGIPAERTAWLWKLGYMS